MLRVGWVSIGNENFGSTRYGVLNIHREFIRIGIFSHILSLNNIFQNIIEKDLRDIKYEIELHKINTVVIHKVDSKSSFDLIDFCKSKGIKVIYSNGDWSTSSIYSKVDQTLVYSNHMKEEISKMYNLSNVLCMDDAVEINENTPIKKHTEKETLVFGWFGNFQKHDYSFNFINSLNISYPFKLITASNIQTSNKCKADIIMGAGTNLPWDSQFLTNTLLSKVDVVLIPLDLSDGDLSKHFAKSSNRVTYPISLGIPVIASPLPSYESIIRHGHNGFLCSDISDWEESLEKLKYCSIREEIGLKSTEDIRKRYSYRSLIYTYKKIFEG